MTPKSIARRLVNGEMHYVLGRFLSVRRTYSLWQGACDALRLSKSLQPLPTTLFAGVDVERAVADIRRDAVHIGLHLPANVRRDIEAFGKAEPLHPGNEPLAAEFHYQDVRRGFADGRRLPLGGVRNPMRCEAVRKVVLDPTLIAIVRAYLGYAPRRALTLLTWSFASDFTDEERRKLKQHVIDYHYDAGGFNFVYANFYILDTDRNSGAHMMMKRSHGRKPLRMLLGSAVASEVDVKRVYGPDNEILIEGPAGTGFIQDTSCYHRATPPTQRDRLMLAVRYS